jgi:molybdopterin converting factor small subunit
MGNEMTVYDANQDVAVYRPPEVVLAEAQKAAKALADVVSKKVKPVIMNGEQYLEFEDWQTVGRFYGVTAKTVSTAFIEYGSVQGFEARAVAIRADGMELSGAEAMCLNDEPNWKSKPLFQLRSMAQTRACAKALRNVLAWVVVLAGYKPTPAEEMQGVYAEKPPLKEPQKKAATTDAAQTVTAIIASLAAKEGEKNGNKYKRFVITDTNGTEYVTFDTKIAENAKVAHGENISVNISFTTGKFGNDIKELTLNIPEEAREAGQEG